MATILLYGDTVRYAAMRHEVPLEIMDPFLFVARDGRGFATTSSLERARIAKALPEAELLTLRRPRGTSWSFLRSPAGVTIPASARCRPTCQSRSTSGRGTRRAAAGPT